MRELMRLGRQGFAPQLLSYLAAYPSLLWLAQAAGGQWGDAAETLLVAARAAQVRAHAAQTSRSGASASILSIPVLLGRAGRALRPQLNGRASNVRPAHATTNSRNLGTHPLRARAPPAAA